MDYNVERTETTTSTGDGIAYNPFYIKTLPALLKIAEMVLTLITFICAVVDPWSAIGGGWVQFVAISAMITTLVFFIFHLFNVISKLPGPWVFIEFVYYCIYLVMIFIAAVLSAARAGQYGLGGIIAATIFCWAALAVYAVDTFFQFRNWREAQSRPATAGTGTTASTTTTTTSHIETRTQY